MTQDEYLQLMQKSHAFKKMPVDLQKSVMGATGELMLKYADIFLDEQKMIVHAQKEFLENNTKIIQEIGGEILKVKKGKLAKDETRSRAMDEKVEQSLLEQINNI